MNRTRKKRQIKFPPPFRPLFRPARYKVYYGGRGGGEELDGRPRTLDQGP